MLRVYIADTDSSFIARVRQVLSRSRGIEIVGTTDNGRRALKDTFGLRPDVLLTDFQLPELDGFALLKETQQLSHAPQVIICTHFYSSDCMEFAFKNGATYFLCKPIDYDRLSEVISLCTLHFHGEGTDEAAEADQHAAARRLTLQLLSDFSISPALKGSVYMVEAMQCLLDNHLLLRNLSHGLYAELSKRMHATVPAIERALRNAIGIGYSHSAMKKVFSNRPSNKEFLEYLYGALNALRNRDSDHHKL